MRSLVFPILLFRSISLHCSLKKAFLSLLNTLWKSALAWLNLSFSFLPFTSLLLAAICKASSDNHFALLNFIFLGMVLVMPPVKYKPLPYYFSHSIRSNPLNLSLPLYNHKEFDLGHTRMASWFSLLSSICLNFAIRNLWFEPQSAPCLVFADCIELLHLWLQRI